MSATLARGDRVRMTSDYRARNRPGGRAGTTNPPEPELLAAGRVFVLLYRLRQGGGGRHKHRQDGAVWAVADGDRRYRLPERLLEKVPPESAAARVAATEAA